MWLPLGARVLKEARMQMFSCTIISAGMSNQMATCLGPAVQKLAPWHEPGRDRALGSLSEVAERCAEAARHLG